MIAWIISIFTALCMNLLAGSLQAETCSLSGDAPHNMPVPPELDNGSR